MMKLGCMSLSYKDLFAAGAMDLEGFIDRAYELKLDGIDVHTGAFASKEPALPAEYQHAVSEARAGDLLYRCEQRFRQAGAGACRRGFRS